jgi:hypothetical protein
MGQRCESRSTPREKKKKKGEKEKRKKSKFPRTSSLAREGLNPALVEVMMF